jgi:hypothetical protein
LEIRRSRASELDAFRVALAELATHIDPTERVPDLDAQIHDVVVGQVDPALRDLGVALAAAKLDAVAKLGRSAKGIAAGTVSAALSFAAGVPLNLTAAVGTLGAVVAALLDYSIERRKLLHGSQGGNFARLPEY